MRGRNTSRNQSPKRLTASRIAKAKLQSSLSEHETEKNLRLQIEELKSIIDTAGDEICRVDVNGTIVYVNDRVVDLLGYTREEILGKNFFDFPIFRKDTYDGIFQVFNESKGSPSRALTEIELVRKDGSTVFVEVNLKPWIKSGKVEGVVNVIRDISERKRYEAKLRELYEEEHRLREQIEAEMQRRVDFTRIVAHELKTPLTPVLASIESLQAELQDKRLLTLAQNVSRGAHMLNSRIDELLDLARGEIGMLKLKLEPIDILPILQEFAHNTMPLASAQGISFITDLPESLPIIQADSGRLQQVVINLLDNAFKFTPRGGHVILAARDEGDRLRVEVSDTGPGMSREQQERVFEPYHRLETVGDHSSGLGLGLALCKTLVELHGGQIEVKSSPGSGSTLYFSLPMEVASRTAKGQESDRSWKILIIEDNREIIDAISLILEKQWGHAELVTSRIGVHGLELVETENPDIVILDLGLPDIDGFEVLRQIRLFSNVPVVVLTVRGGEEDIARALDLGANDYLTKPFRTKELLARLRAQLCKQNPSDGETSIICGALHLAPATCHLFISGRVIDLTMVECLILKKLMRNAGRVVTYTDLAEAIWNEDHPGVMANLRTYMWRLRQKLRSAHNSSKLIITKPGIGYYLVKQS